MEGINRFIKAQLDTHALVVRELEQGFKKSHWMWFTFPQIKGLGHSDTAKYYEIQSMKELDDFVHNHYLAYNLLECINILLDIPTNNAIYVFGEIDAQKLQSSMTLFRHTKIFRDSAQAVLDKYFKGKRDKESEKIIKSLGGK